MGLKAPLTTLMSPVLTGLLSGLLWVIARMPNGARQWVVRSSGGIYAALASESRRTVVTNVRHAAPGLLAHGVDVGDPEVFARNNLKTTMRLLDEIAVCWRGPPDAWRPLIDTVQGDNIDEILGLLRAADTKISSHASSSSGTDESSPDAAGVLLLSPHLGNWELLNMYLGAEFGLTVLYDPPKIGALDPLIQQARSRTRSTVLPIGPGGLRGMVQRLKEAGVVGLLPDQVPSVEAGVRVPFFGKQALTINLVHRLATRFEPRVFLVCAIRNPAGRFDIFFDELTEVFVGAAEDVASAGMNSAIEARIASAPEQYQWSYKRYKRADENGPNIYRANVARKPGSATPVK